MSITPNLCCDETKNRGTYTPVTRWRFSLSLLHPSLEARRNVQNPTLLPNLFQTWVPTSSVIAWSGTWATAGVWGHTDVALPFLQGVKFISTCCIIFALWNWRDSEQASPKCASVANGLFWVEDNRGSKDLGRVFSLPFICLKEFRWRAWSRKKTITRGNYKETWAKCDGLGGTQQGPFIQLHGKANICLPNICSCHLLVNCFPSLRSTRTLPASS